MSLDYSKSRILGIPDVNDKDEGIIKFSYAYFGDFLDDLFSKKIASRKIGGKPHPLIQWNKYSVESGRLISNLLPDEWLKDLANTTPYFTHIRKPKKYKDYKIGNNIIKRFLISPCEVKQKLTKQIKSFIFSPGVIFNENDFKDYILAITNLEFSDKYQTMLINNGYSTEEVEKLRVTYEERLVNIIGKGETKDKVKSIVQTFLDSKKYAEVLALFVLAFIVLQKINIQYDEQTNNDLLNLIWFDSEELSEVRTVPSSILSEFLKTYELKNQIKEFKLGGRSYKQECYIINGELNKGKVWDKNIYEYVIVNLSDENKLGDAILTAKEGYKVKVLLFEKDDDGNLEDCIKLLDMLYKCKFANNNELKTLSDNIDIYVCADFDYASMLIDSVINDNESVYFRVHICDYNKLSAQKLLRDAPVFLPNIIDTSDIEVVIFGTNDSTLRLTEEIIATTYATNVPSVSVVGLNANFYQKKLKQKLPGVYKTEDRIKRIIPRFYECDIESEDFIDLLTNKSAIEDELSLSSVLLKGSYFVVDLGDDKESIMFARRLRAWLLGCDNNFSRSPFIAVKCQNGRNADIARHLVINNKKAGDKYFNNYNLYFYGMIEDIFSSENLDIASNRMQQKALNIHLSYWGKKLSEKDKENAIKSYYKFSYNRDSSECASISIDYMLYSLGVIKKIEDLCWSDEKKKEEYEKWLMEDLGNIDIAARYENSRWVGFLLSRGWQSATLEQVQAYSGQESGADHKHLLCKLHPFICNWEDFDDDSEEVVKIRALQNKITGLNTPKDSTYNIVKAIGEILTKNPFEKIKDITEESR